MPSLTFSQSIEFAILTFNQIGRLIFITADIDGQTGSFLIDTGYRGILLNKDYFEGEQSNLYLRGTNGQGGSLEVKQVDLQIGLLRIPDLRAEIGDINHLETSVGIPLLGIIGSTFFEGFEHLIDYHNNTLILVKLNENGEKMVNLLPMEAPTDTIPLRFKGHLPVIEARIGPNPVRLAIDTGASSNLFRSNIFSKLREWIWKLEDHFLKGLGAYRKRTRAGIISKVQMQDFAFRSMRTLFTNISHLNRDLAGPSLDGILGYEFLSQYKMSFNYKKKELYLWKNSGEEKERKEAYAAGNRYRSPDR